ncbi:N-6 DNA methylase [Ilumatobacter sp.]|uniref:N-6 DNA methylase n=1 Tax=Ilumatobacter sp. TaxID=1967498 RepID=UPI003B51A482
MAAPDTERRRRGAWYTPPSIVERVVDAVVDVDFARRSRGGRAVRVLDPACGDGRFLLAVRAALRRHGVDASLHGVDVDAATVTSLAAATDIEVVRADALGSEHLSRRAGEFDLVIGNPPFLSQMSAETTRAGSSRHGGGPYMNAAAEFLALGAELVDPDGGRLALVLPQSLLCARDAAGIRRRIDERATMLWSTWTGELDFADARVVTCALAFEFAGAGAAPSGARCESTADRSVDPAADPLLASFDDGARDESPGGGPVSRTGAVRRGDWSHVVTERAGIPPVASVLDRVSRRGRLGDRARLNSNFRDEYYGMIPAVGDHLDGPRLVTSGTIDPGRSRWGERPVRFAKRRFAAPRLDLEALDPAMRAWAERRLVPKVLVANQTSVIEAVLDEEGRWLPAVPVIAAYPDDVATGWEVAAVLTSPSASVWAWHRRAGTGLSSTTIRLGPTLLADLPWPEGPLDDAVDALRRGDVAACGEAVERAYGVAVSQSAAATVWWARHLERIESRAPSSDGTAPPA